jgi:CheY-like chemotaxis protein
VSELQTAATQLLPIPSAAAAIAHPLVLIADADPLSRMRRRQQLEDRGFRVTVASTGFEAIVKASCHLPDLILIDVSLSDGVSETAELLSSSPATQHIPIVRLRSGRPVPSRIVAVARR